MRQKHIPRYSHRSLGIRRCTGSVRREDRLPHGRNWCLSTRSVCRSVRTYPDSEGPRSSFPGSLPRHLRSRRSRVRSPRRRRHREPCLRHPWKDNPHSLRILRIRSRRSWRPEELPGSSPWSRSFRPRRRAR